MASIMSAPSTKIQDLGDNHVVIELPSSELTADNIRAYLTDPKLIERAEKFRISLPKPVAEEVSISDPKALAESHAISVVVCDVVLEIRELGSRHSSKSLTDRVALFCTSLSKNALSLDDQFTILKQFNLLFAVLTASDKMHYFRPNLVIEPGTPISVTYIVMALGNLDLFNSVLICGATIPKTSECPPISPEFMRKYKELVDNHDRMRAIKDVTSFDQFTSLFYPGKAAIQKKHAAFYEGHKLVLQDIRGKYKQWKEAVQKFSGIRARKGYATSRSDLEKLNIDLSLHSFNISQLVYTALETIDDLYNIPKDLALNVKLSSGLTQAAMVLLYLEKHSEFHSSQVKAVVANIENSAQVMALVNQNYELRKAAVVQVKALIKAFAPTLIPKIRKYFPEFLYEDLSHVAKIFDKTKPLVPLTVKNQYQAYLERILAEARRQLEVLWRSITAGVPVPWNENLKILYNKTGAKVDPVDYFCAKTIEIEGSFSDINTLNKYISLSTAEAFVKEHFQEAFSAIAFVQIGLQNVKMIVEGISCLNEEACERAVQAIFEADNALSHAEVVAGDKTVQKRITGETRRKRAETKEQMEVKKAQDLAEQQRLKAIEDKKQKEKEKILEKVPNLTPDEVILFEQILNQEDLHKFVEEDRVVKFLEDKLKIPARETKSGWLFDIGENPVSFHRSHGEDRSGTVDGAFFKDVRKALVALGISIEGVRTARAVPPAKKPLDPAHAPVLLLSATAQALTGPPPAELANTAAKGKKKKKKKKPKK